MELKKAIEIADEYHGRIKEDYSGRGMCGETTTAVVLDSSSFYDFKQEHEGEFRSDSLGMDIVVY